MPQSLDPQNKALQCNLTNVLHLYNVTGSTFGVLKSYYDQILEYFFFARLAVTYLKYMVCKL